MIVFPIPKHRSVGKAKRQGLAPLEMVMALPVLMLVTLVIVAFAQGSIARTSAAVKARREGWNRRPGHQSASPLKFSITRADQVGASTSERVPKPPGLPISVPNAQSTNQSMAGSWDHDDVKFGKTPLFVPHLGVFSRLVSNGNLNVNLSRGELNKISKIGREAESAMRTFGGNSEPQVRRAKDMFLTNAKKLSKILRDVNNAVGKLKKLSKGKTGNKKLDDLAGKVTGEATKALGKALKEIGKSIGGDVGKAIENFGGSVKDAVKAFEDLVEFIEEIQSFSTKATDAFAKMLDPDEDIPEPPGAKQIERFRKLTELAEKIAKFFQPYQAGYEEIQKQL